jgi:transcriptional regulator with PAS, ATPase and Fis domain
MFTFEIAVKSPCLLHYFQKSGKIKMNKNKFGINIAYRIIMMHTDEKFGKILIVDDDEDVLQAGRLFLKQHVELVHFDSYNLEAVEKTVICRVLERYKGNISKAAQELGLTRTSLYRRMEKYGI